MADRGHAGDGLTQSVAWTVRHNDRSRVTQPYVQCQHTHTYTRRVTACAMLVMFVVHTRALHGVGNPYGYGYGVDFGWIWIFFVKGFGVEWVMG